MLNLSKAFHITIPHYFILSKGFGAIDNIYVLHIYRGNYHLENSEIVKVRINFNKFGIRKQRPNFIPLIPVGV